MTKLISIDDSILFSKDTWLTNDELDALTQEYPHSWQIEAYRNFTTIIGQENFPCLFAKHSLKSSKQHFIFLDNLQNEELNRFNEIIPHYVTKIRVQRLKKEFIQPLLVLVNPTLGTTLKEHRQQAWDILQYLHDHDSQAWPSHTPKDPTHKDWSFCHSGEQLFTNISSPYHQEYHSRNLGLGLTLAINPRKNFDKVAPKGASGYRIRKRIQERSRVYDNRKESTPVAFYGDESHLEWSMYALPEKQEPLTGQCPFKHKKE